MNSTQVLGLTFDTKLTFKQHIDNTKEKAQKSINILKALTATKWGKQKETIVATYKAITRPTIEYASSIWPPKQTPTHCKQSKTQHLE